MRADDSRSLAGIPRRVNAVCPSSSRLRLFCYWLRHEKLQLATLPAAKETDGLRERADRSLLIDAEQRAAEDLAWLTGLWSARGIAVPSIETLEELAASRARAVNRRS